MTVNKEMRVQIPHHFRCPISLDLMRDPVTLSTGQTYDRDSIQKWVGDGNATCPATMQRLHDKSLTPNHTLRKLIQDWCVANRSKGVERIPTPRHPPDPQHLARLVQDISTCPSSSASSSLRRSRLQAVKQVRSLAKESDKNRQLIVDAGAVPVLIQTLSEDASSSTRRPRRRKTSSEAAAAAGGGLELRHTLADPVLSPGCKPVRLAVAAATAGRAARRAQDGIGEEEAQSGDLCEEAVAALALLPLSHAAKMMLARKESAAALAALLRQGSMEARVHAAALVETLTSSDHHLKQLLGSTRGVIDGLVALLRHHLYPMALKVGIRGLLSVCLDRANRDRAVACGAASALLELLPGLEQPGDVERALATLELLCKAPQGCQAVAAHALAVPALSNMIRTFSAAATEYATASLLAICSHTDALQLEAVQAGVFTHLLLLLQTDCSSRAKRKSLELLKLLWKVWAAHPCSSDFGRTDISPF